MHILSETQGTEVDIVVDLETLRRIQQHAIESGPILFDPAMTYADVQTVLTLYGFRKALAEIGIRPQFDLEPQIARNPLHGQGVRE